MAKSGLKIRVPASGRTIGVTFKHGAFEELLEALPESQMRTELAAGLADARIKTGASGREKRLDTPLSIEALSMVGWMMTGEHSKIAYGAIREGDFRLATFGGRQGWEYGMRGAFDRDPDQSHILRDAFQGGVFSELHKAYRMMDPTIMRTRAITRAERLEDQWKAALPAKVITPVAEANNPLRSRSSRIKGGLVGRLSTDHLHLYRTDEDLANYPEGTRFWQRARPTADAVLHHGTHLDEKLFGTDRSEHVSVFACEAVLRPSRGFDKDMDACVTHGMRWCVGRRLRDAAFVHDEYLLDGPYDLVAGTVWAAYTNKAPLYAHHVGGQVNMQDPGEREYVAVTSREGIEDAAHNLAVRCGFTEGDLREVETVAVPTIKSDAVLGGVWGR